MYDRAYFQRFTEERTFYDRGVLRPDQIAAIWYALGYTPSNRRLERDPGHILSIGCGLGRLEAELARIGLTITAQDVADNREHFTARFILGNLDAVPDEDFKTVIFCESLEHIPPDEFERNWPRLVAILKRTHGMLIVANWEHYHPIIPNGADHVLRVDDALYDRVARWGFTRHRSGSHLVLEF